MGVKVGDSVEVRARKVEGVDWVVGRTPTTAGGAVAVAGPVDVTAEGEMVDMVVVENEDVEWQVRPRSLTSPSSLGGRGSQRNKDCRLTEAANKASKEATRDEFADGGLVFGLTEGVAKAPVLDVAAVLPGVRELADPDAVEAGLEAAAPRHLIHPAVVRRVLTLPANY